MKIQIFLLVSLFSMASFADVQHKCFESKDFSSCMELCNTKVGRACFGVGFFYETGKGVIKDYTKASTYYESIRS